MIAIRAIAALLGLAAFISGAAAAQSATQSGAAAHKAGDFDYYALVLSWSPTFCAELEPGRTDPQCSANGGRRYAFVLHGLWPQYERGWPERCPTADGGFVPRAAADRMLDIVPSRNLVFHEYRKHGTCSGLGVDGYLAQARRLYEKVAIPAAFKNVSDARFFVSPASLESQFLAANPGLRADAISIACGGSGDRLRDVHICFDKSGAFTSCGANQDQQRLCRAQKMYVPPVR